MRALRVIYTTSLCLRSIYKSERTRDHRLSSNFGNLAVASSGFPWLISALTHKTPNQDPKDHLAIVSENRQLDRPRFPFQPFLWEIQENFPHRLVVLSEPSLPASQSHLGSLFWGVVIARRDVECWWCIRVSITFQIKYTNAIRFIVFGCLGLINSRYCNGPYLPDTHFRLKICRLKDNNFAF